LAENPVDKKNHPKQTAMLRGTKLKKTYQKMGESFFFIFFF